MSGNAMRRTVAMTFDEALARVPEALRTEGFGVLTEVDVRDTLAKKLGVEFRRYRILGACNPPLAHRALQVESEAGLMMPCNVIVFEGEDGRTVVAAVDPEKSIGALGNPALGPIAAEVRQKLMRVLERL